MNAIPVFLVLAFFAFLIDNPWFVAEWVNEFMHYRNGSICHGEIE